MMTSVTGVEVTPDLKFCKVYISVLGDEEAKADTMAGLKSAAGFIRRELARTVNLRNTPELKFVMDQSIEYGMKMSKLIDEVNGIIKSDGTTVLGSDDKAGIAALLEGLRISIKELI